VEWIFYLPGLLAIATNIIFFLNIFRFFFVLSMEEGNNGGPALQTFF
jgi:hypothetical protein